MAQNGYPALDRRRVQTSHAEWRGINRLTYCAGAGLLPVANRISCISSAPHRMSTIVHDLTASHKRIAAAYDPAALKEAGTRLLSVVADHLRRVETRDSKVLNWNKPATLIKEAREFLTTG